MTSPTHAPAEVTTEEIFGEHQYLIFRLNEELYGVRLLDVNEVVDELSIQRVPNTISSFLGVANLRGALIGVVDLKKQFSMKSSTSERAVYLVFSTSQGTLACTVDQILQVGELLPSDIEKEVNIVSAIPSQYLKGIGKKNGRLITLVDLAKILSQQELLDIEKSRLLATGDKISN